MIVPTKEQYQRFVSKIDFMDDCWMYKADSKLGYGKISFDNVCYLAHRLSYGWFVGPIPEKYNVHHLCRNEACVNPAHLEALSSFDHLTEHPTVWHNRFKTHCSKGHPYSGDNLGYQKWNGKITGRRCKQCQLAYDAKYRAKKRLS